MPTDSELHNFSIRSNILGFLGRFYRSSYFSNVAIFFLVGLPFKKVLAFYREQGCSPSLKIFSKNMKKTSRHTSSCSRRHRASMREPPQRRHRKAHPDQVDSCNPANAAKAGPRANCDAVQEETRCTMWRQPPSAKTESATPT